MQYMHTYRPLTGSMERLDDTTRPGKFSWSRRRGREGWFLTTPKKGKVCAKAKACKRTKRGTVGQ